MPLQVLSKLRLPVTPVAPIDVTRLMDLTTGDEVNYSITPVNTGVTWVEGSPVFRVVFISNTGSAINTNNNVGHAQAFVALVRISGYAIGLDGFRYPLTLMVHEDGRIMENHAYADLNNRRLIVILDYVPETTLLTTWDLGTTIWDGGNTSWDT